MLYEKVKKSKSLNFVARQVLLRQRQRQQRGAAAVNYCIKTWAQPMIFYIFDIIDNNILYILIP